MKRFLNILQYSLFFLILFFTVVLSVEWVCSRIVVNEEQPKDGIKVYLLSNGVHTDLVLPVTSPYIHWDTVFARHLTQANDTTLAYIGVGWGDKGFYLETPTWADLKFSTALNATMGWSSSALHCTYMNEPVGNELSATAWISPEQYSAIIEAVKTTYSVNGKQEPVWINTDAVYGSNDIFFEANGSYNLFRTCNTWTNSVLKKAKMKAAVWVAFSKPLMEIYK